MKQYLPTIFLALFFVTANSQVTINEYSTSNLSGYLDNYEKTEDWI